MKCRNMSTKMKYVSFDVISHSDTVVDTAMLYKN